MLTTSTLRALGQDGRLHTVRIGEGYGNVRYIECESCGIKRMAQFLARDKAEDHLTTVHGVARDADGALEGARREFSPLPWIVAAAGAIVFMALLFAQRPGG